jgi:hypothetical protein
MKNSFAAVLALIILSAMILGCSFFGKSGKTTSEKSPDNKNFTDKTIDSAVGGEKIGIPECDAVVDELAASTESNDEGYVIKAFRAYYVGKIREELKKSIEHDKTDPAALAKECKKLQEQLAIFKAQEDEKKK